MAHNPMYRLMDINMGGRLITTFQEGGMAALKEMCAKELPIYLYNSGKGKTINHSEYSRWRQHKQNKPTKVRLDQIIRKMVQMSPVTFLSYIKVSHFLFS